MKSGQRPEISLARRFQWIFVAFFILLALPLTLIEDRESETGQLYAALAVVSLSGFAFCLAWDSWQTGQIKLPEFNYTRADHPKRFYASLLMIVGAGTGALIAALMFLLANR